MEQKKYALEEKAASVSIEGKSEKVPLCYEAGQLWLQEALAILHSLKWNL